MVVELKGVHSHVDEACPHCIPKVHPVLFQLWLEKEHSLLERRVVEGHRVSPALLVGVAESLELGAPCLPVLVPALHCLVCNGVDCLLAEVQLSISLSEQLPAPMAQQLVVRNTVESHLVEVFDEKLSILLAQILWKLGWSHDIIGQEHILEPYISSDIVVVRDVDTSGSIEGREGEDGQGSKVRFQEIVFLELLGPGGKLLKQVLGVGNKMSHDLTGFLVDHCNHALPVSPHLYGIEICFDVSQVSFHYWSDILHPVSLRLLVVLDVSCFEVFDVSLDHESLCLVGDIRQETSERISCSLEEGSQEPILDSIAAPLELVGCI